MAVKVGKIVKITCGTAGSGASAGTYIVSEQGTYTLSGFTRDTVESTSFGDDIKEYTFTQGDGGTVSFSGNYDPADATGQEFLNSYCSNGSVFTSGMIRFYVDNTFYMTPNGGSLLITKIKAIGFEKAGIGTISFEGKLSGSDLVRISN